MSDEVDSTDSSASSNDAITTGASPSNLIERIYVGGLEPPNLTPRDLWKRIQAIKDIEILEASAPSDEQDTKPYFHIQARSTTTQSSALGTISKQYNNVKWKGCRIVVEGAKPHFLERLKMEQEERRLAILESAVEEAATGDAKDDTADAHVNNLPRRLRVRKRFGEEAFHIDTKPWSVESWKRFSMARTKLQNRLDKHQEKCNNHKLVNKKRGKNATPQANNMPIPPYHHRAIHIRFDTNDDNDRNSPSRNDWNHDKVPHAESISDDDDSGSSSSDASSSDSEEASSLSSRTASVTSEPDGNEQDRTPNQKSYSWSDDESADEGEEDDESESEEKVQTGSARQSDNNNEKAGSDEEISSEEEEEEVEKLEEPSKPSHHWMEEDDDDDDDSDGDEEQPIPAPKDAEEFEDNDSDEKAAKPVATTQMKQQEVQPEKAYEWSSDEESSSDESSTAANKNKNRPFQTVPTAVMDEFAAGWSDADDDDNDESNDNDSDMRSEAQQVERTDLTNDVTSNMNILSGIFPELAQTKVSQPDESESNQGQTSKARGPIMPRFDPNDASTHKFVLQDDEGEEKKEKGSDDSESDDSDSSKGGDDQDSASGDSEKSGASGDDDDDDSNGEDKAEAATAAVVKQDQLYEEKKLEDVFREARTSRNTDSAASSVGAQPSGGGGFSFGFDLGGGGEAEVVKPPSTNDKTAAGGFSFGFSIPSSDDKMEEDDNVNNNKTDAMDVEADKPAAPKEKPRHSSIFLPSTLLDKWESHFYSSNDGKAILADPEGFRNSQEVKQKWLKERQSLTLDWKRKRKHAQSRIQKRMKLR